MTKNYDLIFCFAQIQTRNSALIKFGFPYTQAGIWIFTGILLYSNLGFWLTPSPKRNLSKPEFNFISNLGFWFTSSNLKFSKLEYSALFKFWILNYLSQTRIFRTELKRRYEVLVPKCLISGASTWRYSFSFPEIHSHCFPMHNGME